MNPPLITRAFQLVGAAFTGISVSAWCGWQSWGLSSLHALILAVLFIALGQWVPKRVGS